MSIAVPRKEGGKDGLLMLELYENCPDFLDIYGLELLDAPHTLHLLPRTSVPVIVNEAFIRYLVPEGENPVGQPLSKYAPENKENATIIGVMKDFKKYSLTQQVFPLRMILHETPRDNYKTLTLRIDEPRRTEATRRLREVWEQKNPGIPFKYSEPYQTLVSNNREVTDLSRILLMYAAISLFLTLSGLFGITHYAIRQRIREIGIRKIHGASFGQILWLMNRPFFHYIGIAFVLIAPLVYWLMDRWLQQFVYHASIGVSHFLLPLLLTAGITLLTVCLNSYRVARSNPAIS